MESLQGLLDRRFVIVEAGQANARVGVLDSSKSADLLPPEGNHDWDNIQVSSVKVEVSATHPSVAAVSFTLKQPLDASSVARLQEALDTAPGAFDESKRSEITTRIANRAVHYSEFAMLARRDGRWKIVSVSVPR